MNINKRHLRQENQRTLKKSYSQIKLKKDSHYTQNSVTLKTKGSEINQLKTALIVLENSQHNAEETIREGAHIYTVFRKSLRYTCT